MTRWFFVTAALYNAAWMVFLFVAPERVLLKQPPLLWATALLIGGVGGCFAVCAVRVRKPLVLFGILAKLGGPPMFVLAVLLGYQAWSQAWLPVVNDLV